MSTPPLGHQHTSSHSSTDNPFQLIEACLNRRRCREEDYQEAMEHLLSLVEELKSGSEISVATLYSYLLQLIPHLEEEKLTRFCANSLSRLLMHSPDRHEEHRKLALALGNWKLAHPRGENLEAILQASRDALDNYVEAIAIAEEHGLEVDETHRQASAPFAQILKYTLRLELPIKQRLRDAARAWQNDPDQFFKCYEDLESHLEILRHFPCDEEGEELIRGVYRTILEALNLTSSEFKQQHRFQEGNYFTKLRQKLTEPFPRPTQWPTQRYLEGLKKFREPFNALPLGDVRDFQTETTDRFIALFQDTFFSDVEALFLGFFPCPYDVRAMGSIASMQLTRRFDLEYLILIADETKRDFFRHVAELLWIQILSVGESPLAASSTHTLRETLPLRLKNGLHVDSGGNPAQQSEVLIRTPEKIAELQLSAADDPQSLEHTIRKTISLKNSEGAGDASSLNRRFQMRLTQIFDPERDPSLRENKATTYMIRRLMAYREMPPPFVAPQGEMDLKKQFVEPFHLLGDVAFLCGVPGNHPLDLIEGLACKGIFSARSKELLIKAFSCVYARRTGVQGISERKDVVSYGKGMPVPGCAWLKEEEQKELEQIYWLALRPLYTALGRCFTIVPNSSDRKARAELEGRPNILILRPSERETQPTYIRVTQPFKTAFQNLDLVNVGFEEIITSQQKNPTFFKPFIEQWVSFSMQQQLSSSEFLRYFQILTKREDLEHLGKIFLKTRVKALVEMGKEGEAFEVLSQVLTNDPNNVAALMLRGKFFTELGRHGEALPDFHRVVCVVS